MIDGPVLRDFLLGDRAEGAWKDAFVRRGHRFPEDVYELTPLDADPDAEKWMLENWVYDPTADPEYLAAIARETSRTPLGTWLGAARALLSFDNRMPLAELTVPTLVLWPTQDNVVPRSPYQTDLLASLDRAAEPANGYVFKQYGTRPLPLGLQKTTSVTTCNGPPAKWPRSRFWLRDGGEPTEDHYFADREPPRGYERRRALDEGVKNCPATEMKKEGEVIYRRVKTRWFMKADSFRARLVVPVSFSKYR
jgi:hypothetical protein